MTYWDMQVHPGSRREDFPVEKVIELIKRSGRIGMGDGWVNELVGTVPVYLNLKLMKSAGITGM